MPANYASQEIVQPWKSTFKRKLGWLISLNHIVALANSNELSSGSEFSAVCFLQAAAAAAALQDQLKLIFEGMPRDLQQTMLSSPHRAALLQSSGPQTKARLSNAVTSMIGSLSGASCSACFCKAAWRVH